jgi:hypothetical protein
LAAAAMVAARVQKRLAVAEWGLAVAARSMLPFLPRPMFCGDTFGNPQKNSVHVPNSQPRLPNKNTFLQRQFSVSFL